MKIKNIWKYLFMIGTISILITLISSIILLVFTAQTGTPDWLMHGLSFSISVLGLSVLILVVTEFETILSEIKEFLK